MNVNRFLHRITRVARRHARHDLSQKSPVELLLDLSSDRLLEEGEIAAVMQLIAVTALDILHIEFAAIWLLDDARERLVCQAQGSAADAAQRSISRQDMPEFFALLQQDDGPLISHDVRLHPAASELPQLFGAHALHSVLEIPVRMHGENIGALCFGQSSRQRDWSREDVLFGSHIGNLVQQVLAQREHVRIQHELEQRVQRRTRELQLQTEQLRQAQENIFRLSEIGREITSSLDRDTIMDIVYRHVHELMGAEVFAVGLYRPEQGVIEFPCNILRGQRMLPYARDTRDPDLLSVWCVTHQKEIYINDIFTEYRHYIGAAGLDKLTVDSAYPDQRQKITPVSLIYAPLVIKHRSIGVIAIQSTEKNAFQRMHADMAMTLAAYTAIALDNAYTYQQLAKAQQILMSKEKLAALGALVTGIAHELNTPIGNSLLTASTLLEQSVAFMRKMHANTLRRSDLATFAGAVNDANELLMRNLSNASDLVCSFKQVSADQTSQQRRRFNLAQTTQEIVRTLQSRIKKRGHTLEVDIPVGIELDSYPGPYGQVLANFINNAMLHGFEQHTPGSMRLSARLVAGDAVEIVFSDNGKGIGDDDLRRIFDPFFTTKLGHGGSGLGLSIVHNLVYSVMGGKIDVESALGQGTRFTLSLPLHAAAL
ncbi:MAG: GAF domain-containing protein [Burkholderiales bacterium]|nr:GAF domain-containing protein [Burkholderiales bacterium]